MACVKGSPLKAFVSWRVYRFPRAAITKYHKPGDSKQQKLTALEARCLKPSRGQGHALSKALAGDPPLLLASGVGQQSLGLLGW